MFKERMFLRRRASGMLLSIMMTYFLYQIEWVQTQVLWLHGMITAAIQKSGIDVLISLLPLVAISLTCFIINIILYNLAIKRLNFRMDDKGGVDNQIEGAIGSIFITLYFFYILYISFPTLFMVRSDNTLISTLFNGTFPTLFGKAYAWNVVWVAFPLFYLLVINWTNNVISDKMNEASSAASAGAHH